MSKKDSAALSLVDAPTSTKKPLDLTGAVNVTTLTVPQMMAMTGGHGLVVGGEFAGGGNFSGVVRRMALMPSGVVIVIVELGAAFRSTTGNFGAFSFFGNGMYSEIDNDAIEPITEENCGPWQRPIGEHR